MEKNVSIYNALAEEHDSDLEREEKFESKIEEYCHDKLVQYYKTGAVKNECELV